MIRLHPVIVKVGYRQIEEVGTLKTDLYKPEPGNGIAYRVSSHRKPRGYIIPSWETVSYRGGDGRYEATLDYRRELRWEPIGLQDQTARGLWSLSHFPTKQAAINALLSYQDFR